MGTAGAAAAAERQRERRVRKLVSRYVEACALISLMGCVAWLLGRTPLATVAVLCIGLPILALFRHVSERVLGNRGTAISRRSASAFFRPLTEDLFRYGRFPTKRP